MSDHPHSHHAGPDVSAGDIAQCPVSRVAPSRSEAEEDGLVRDYDGTHYYFCCADCLPMFDADPARYANA